MILWCPRSDWRKQDGRSREIEGHSWVTDRWGYRWAFSLRNTADTALNYHKLIQWGMGSGSIVHWLLFHWLRIFSWDINSYCFWTSPMCIGTNSHGCGRKPSGREAESCRYLRREAVQCKELSTTAAGKNVLEEWMECTSAQSSLPSRHGPSIS